MKTAIGTLLGLILLATSDVPADQLTGGACGTQFYYGADTGRDTFEGQALPACLNDGPCDLTELRDLYVPGTGATIITVRLAIHVLAHSDGSYPFATPAAVQEAVDQINFHFLSSRIRFEYVLDQVNSDEWRVLSEDEIDPMKIATATDPTRWLNVWITSVLFGYSFGTMPYAPDVLGPTGGIVMGQNHWGGNHSGLAHEIGHCFGLMHNFYGVSEVAACGPCYEAMDAVERDLLGDHCSDTPPAPIWYDCSDATGTDVCSGLAWGPSLSENIMSYTPVDCRTLFTPHQQGRMRCWLNDIMSGWILSQEFCCNGRVGDANGLGGDEPTIADVAILVDAKFITGSCLGLLECLAEADINQSGALAADCEDITMGDISVLIDYLFLTGPSLGLPDCL